MILAIITVLSVIIMIMFLIIFNIVEDGKDDFLTWMIVLGVAISGVICFISVSNDDKVLVFSKDVVNKKYTVDNIVYTVTIDTIATNNLADSLYKLKATK